MGDPRAADHALGIELQIEELVEQRQRAHVQGRTADEAGLTRQLSALYDELASAGEAAAAPDPGPRFLPG